MILQNRFIQILSGNLGFASLQGKGPKHRTWKSISFRGYQSFHGNMPVKGTAVRATAISITENPHETSWATNQIQKMAP